MTYSWTATLWYDDIVPVDCEASGLGYLVWQYAKDQPRAQSFLGALLEQLQSIENVSMDVLAGIWPLTAVGDQLDVLGKIVGQPRGELTDEEYRIFILGRIYVNHMDGKVPEFFELLEILGITETIYYHEAYPCYGRLDVTGASHGKLMGQLVLDAAPAGVDLLWVYNEEDESDSFAFSDTPGSDEVNVNGGFSNLAGTVGGKFSGGSV